VRLHAAIARRRAPRPTRWDALLVDVTGAADNAFLWLTLAAMLVTAGGRPGRRAAAQGVAGMVLSSAIANGPLKLGFRRPRRSDRPLLIAQPASYSFPSGHSATAFGFATGAAGRMPETATVLLPLAAAVAVSRVRVGVHTRVDVVAGAAVGVACGLLVAGCGNGLACDAGFSP
jgi:undecaprenyl-diphosphatase